MTPTALIVYARPVPKPRMTRRDRWQVRPCVAAYRTFADALRLAAKRVTKITLTKPTRLEIRAYFASTAQCGPHTQTPDWDNLGKAVSDALFHNDQMIYEARVLKLWTNGTPARVEVEWG